MVLGIRGMIKKVVKSGEGTYGLKDGGMKEGSFCVLFEDKFFLLDIIFLCMWIKVDVLKFYNLVMLGMMKDTKEWRGMKIVG